MSHVISVDVTNHSDTIPRHRIIGSKLWIVPERVPPEDVTERVLTRGAIVDGIDSTVEGWWAMLVQYPLDPFLYRALR